jgi:hypothetical protein
MKSDDDSLSYISLTTMNNKTGSRRNCSRPCKLVKKRVAAKENPEGKHFGRGAAANWPCQTRQNLISANVVVVDELG